MSPGDSSIVAPPDPISNSEVKRYSAEDTNLEADWENRSLPGLFKNF
jgi:hypothetical protein